MKYTHVIMDHVGGPDVLHMQEDDLPEPRTGEVRIEIIATDVSFSTILMQRGQYPGAPALPFARTNIPFLSVPPSLHISVGP
jgi:NADPH:quinone reductase-like Zn-dependent oxidoreductase